MKVGWLIVFVVLFSLPVAFGQKTSTSNRVSKTKNPCVSGQKLRDRKDPVVFITFVKKERIGTETRYGSDVDYLFFTLTNNSCWPIWLDMSGADDKLGDVRLYVQAEDVKSGTIQHGTLRCHVCSTNPLGPGKKLTFSVPRDYASRSSLMKVAFDFGWERDVHVDGVGVQHTVSFYFNRLPESVLPK